MAGWRFRCSKRRNRRSISSADRSDRSWWRDRINLVLARNCRSRRSLSSCCIIDLLRIRRHTGDLVSEPEIGSVGPHPAGGSRG